MTRLELEIDERHVEAAIGIEGNLLTLECDGVAATNRYRSSVAD